MQSWTSTCYFSNSTGSFVSNCRFSQIIELVEFSVFPNSNMLHVDIIVWAFLIDASGMIGGFPEALNFDRLTLEPVVGFMETRILGLIEL